MKPEEALAQAQQGKLLPVYVVVGDERFLLDEVARGLRLAALRDEAVTDFNDDRFFAGESDADTVVAAARTVPMMAKRRVVTVQAVERWEQRSAGTKSSRSPLDALADYALDPSPTTVLIIVATKVHGQRRLMKAAKKGAFLVTCSPLARRELPTWIRRSARERGHDMKAHVTESLAELVGPELGPVADAVERLSLYVGAGAEIDEEAVVQVVTRVRQDTVWQLVDALGQRRLGPALAALADAYDPRDGGLRLLGAVAWSVRQLIKYASARREGMGPRDAAKAAGVPPFKVDQVERNVRQITPRRLETWLARLALTDLSLKSSRRPGRAVIEALLIDLCR